MGSSLTGKTSKLSMSTAETTTTTIPTYTIPEAIGGLFAPLLFGLLLAAVLYFFSTWLDRQLGADR